MSPCSAITPDVDQKGETEMTPDLKQELIEALTKLGMSEEDIAELDLDADLNEDGVRALVGGSMVPDSEKAGVGMAFVLDGLGDRARREEAAQDVFRVAAVAADAGAVSVLGILITLVATAAAVVLDEDDDRTPADFIEVARDFVSRDDAIVAFENLKAVWHERQAAKDLERDLAAFEDEEFNPHDLLG